MQEPPEQNAEAAEAERRQRVVKALLVCSPFGFVLSFVLAAVQGASAAQSLLIATVFLVGCLGWAGIYHLAGAKAGEHVWLIQALLRLFVR